MQDKIILASGSAIRADLLRQADVAFTVQIARIDEGAVRASLQADNASPRDIADTLAELKAQKIASKHPDALVIGCDQILAFDQEILTKPDTKAQAVDQLRALRGRKHQLLSAAVIYGE